MNSRPFEDPSKRRTTDRRHSIKRRMLNKQAAQDRHTRWDTFNRDQGMCQVEECLCPDGRAVNRDWNPKDPWCFEEDHIIPVTQGGDNTINNCRVSHRRCNNARNY